MVINHSFNWCFKDHSDYFRLPHSFCFPVHCHDESTKSLFVCSRSWTNWPIKWPTMSSSFGMSSLRRSRSMSSPGSCLRSTIKPGKMKRPRYALCLFIYSLSICFPNPPTFNCSNYLSSLSSQQPIWISLFVSFIANSIHPFPVCSLSPIDIDSYRAPSSVEYQYPNLQMDRERLLRNPLP